MESCCECGLLFAYPACNYCDVMRVGVDRNVLHDLLDELPPPRTNGIGLRTIDSVEYLG